MCQLCSRNITSLKNMADKKIITEKLVFPLVEALAFCLNLSLPNPIVMDTKNTRRLLAEVRLSNRIVKRSAKRWIKNGIAEYSPGDNAFLITDFGAAVYARLKWKN